MSDEYPIQSSREPLAREYETLTREELKARLQVFIAGLLEHDFQR